MAPTCGLRRLPTTGPDRLIGLTEPSAPHQQPLRVGLGSARAPRRRRSVPSARRRIFEYGHKRAEVIVDTVVFCHGRQNRGSGAELNVGDRRYPRVDEFWLKVNRLRPVAAALSSTVASRPRSSSSKRRVAIPHARSPSSTETRIARSRSARSGGGPRRFTALLPAPGAILGLAAPPALMHIEVESEPAKRSQLPADSPEEIHAMIAVAFNEGTSRRSSPCTKRTR